MKQDTSYSTDLLGVLLHRASGEGNDVLLAGGEVNEIYVVVGELANKLELGAAPKEDTVLVKGNQVGSVRGPHKVLLCPFLYHMIHE
jgi:hypothetical protein